jgi:hypothetical protein
LATQNALREACAEFSPDHVYLEVESFGQYVGGDGNTAGLLDLTQGVPCFAGNVSTNLVVTSNGALLGLDGSDGTSVATLAPDLPTWSLTESKWAEPKDVRQNDAIEQLESQGRCKLIDLFPFPERPGALVRCAGAGGSVVRWIDSATRKDLTLYSPTPGEVLFALGAAELTVWQSSIDTTAARLLLIKAGQVVAQRNLEADHYVRVGRASEDGFQIVLQPSSNPGELRLYSLSATGVLSMVGTYANPDKIKVSSFGDGTRALDSTGALFVAEGGSNDRHVIKFTPDGQMPQVIWRASTALHDYKGGGWFPLNRGFRLYTGGSGAM